VDWLLPLAGVYGCTLIFAALFCLLGTALVPRQFADQAGGGALLLGQTFAVGLSAFLASFVLLAHLFGRARLALAIVLLVTGVVVFVRRRSILLAGSGQSLAPTLAASLALLVAFSVIPLTLWTNWVPSPTAWNHFGSIHGGRYANYSLFIAQLDRVPYLAQNMGQSLLAALHLLLGVRAPLAALMSWLVVALVALTLLLFGTLRAHGLSRAMSAAGTFFVLSCNVALSSNHVMVMDNGSPLAFIGYADLVLSIGTFLVLLAWLERAWRENLGGPWVIGLPALFVCTWFWYAPQNLVASCAAVAGAALATRRGLPRPVAWKSAVVLSTAAVVGATQLGPFLPRALREDPGTLVVLPETNVTVRPYALSVTSPWSDFRWNVRLRDEGDPFGLGGHYEILWSQTASQGQAATVMATAREVLAQFASSIRTYFFPLLGLALMWRLPRPYFAVAMATFAAGYVISFGLELEGIKWWLARFLAPGLAVTLLGGFVAGAMLAVRRRDSAMRVALAVALVAAGFGPARELAWAFRANFVRGMFDQNLRVLVQARGPFEDQRRETRE
jgi:hypothetical protein